MSHEFSRRRRGESGERSEVLRDAAPSSPRESGPSESRSPPINWNYPSVSEPLRLHLCHLEAEVDPLQGKWAVSQTRQMRRDVVRSELLELEGCKLGEKGQRVRLIVGV